jgi:hypothetical protein
LRRWYLIAQNARPNIYLHHFMRSDDDRAFHDHPWSFASLVLRGFYLELTENSGWTMRRPGSITLRRAEHRHRIVLPRNPDETERPWWTLVVTGSRRRQWAFWCGHRFVPWQAFGAGGCDTPSVTS